MFVWMCVLLHIHIAEEKAKRDKPVKIYLDKVALFDFLAANRINNKSFCRANTHARAQAQAAWMRQRENTYHYFLFFAFAQFHPST